MLRAIREELLTGASAKQVLETLVRRQALGQLSGLDLPSSRTIGNIARDMQRDDSPAWRLEDADPQDVRAVLAALREVDNRSAGRIRHLTQREARLVAIYQAAGDDPWPAYVAARGYLAMSNRNEDVTQEALALARRSAGLEAPEPAEEVLEIDYPTGMVDPFLLKENAIPRP